MVGVTTFVTMGHTIKSPVPVLHEEANHTVSYLNPWIRVIILNELVVQNNMSRPRANFYWLNFHFSVPWELTFKDKNPGRLAQEEESSTLNMPTVGSNSPE